MPIGLSNGQAFEKLKNEIVSHIDARHRELLIAQQATLHNLFDKVRAELQSNTPSTMGTMRERQNKASVFGEWRCSESESAFACCSTEPCADKREELLSMNQSRRELIKAYHYDVPNEQEPEGLEPDPTSPPTSERGPSGAFKGRDNLHAFLRCKKWDSKYASEPQTAIDEIQRQEAKNQVVLDPHHPWSKIKSVINSSHFDTFIGLIILINACIMGLELEYEGTHSAQKIGIESDEGHWPNAEEAFFALEHLFGAIYLIELVLRLADVGYAYFKSVLNWIDFVVVLAACLELYILPWATTEAPNLGMIRLMRVIRIVRILRIVRTVKFFYQLRVLVVAVSHSVWSLIWSLILLGIVIVIGSIFMTQSLQSYLQDENVDPVVREQVYTFFGNWSRSVITMFEISIWGGTWGRCGRVVIFSVSRNYAIFFIGYLSLVSFAMIRVIGALFLRDTLASAGKDAELAMQEENRDPRYIHNIWTLFKALDKSNNEALDLYELSLLLEDAEICEGFRNVGVVPDEVPALFTLMDDGNDEVDFSEFLSGIMRLKNKNQGADLPTMLYELKRLLKRVLGVGKSVDELRNNLI